MKHFYQNIDGFFDFEDVYCEAVRTAPNNCTFVELGAYLGKSTAHLAVEIINSKKNIELVVIDKWDWEFITGYVVNTFSKFIDNIKFVLPYMRLNVLQSDSRTAADSVKDRNIHFVFIDTEHQTIHTYQELCEWFPVIRSGGMLGGHDYINSHFGVKTAVDRYANENNLTVKLIKYSFLINKQ